MSASPSAPAPTLSQLALRAGVRVTDVLQAAQRTGVVLSARRVPADKVEVVLGALARA
jgi:hypothetical protein